MKPGQLVYLNGDSEVIDANRRFINIPRGSVMIILSDETVNLGTSHRQKIDGWITVLWGDKIIELMEDWTSEIT